MAKRKIINEDIPSVKVPWDDGTSAYSGEAIEKFLKPAYFKSWLSRYSGNQRC